MLRLTMARVLEGRLRLGFRLTALRHFVQRNPSA
jgi:hypothetical protein